MTKSLVILVPSYIGDYFINHEKNPVINQPAFHGMELLGGLARFRCSIESPLSGVIKWDRLVLGENQKMQQMYYVILKDFPQIIGASLFGARCHISWTTPVSCWNIPPHRLVKLKAVGWHWLERSKGWMELAGYLKNPFIIGNRVRSYPHVSMSTF